MSPAMLSAVRALVSDPDPKIATLARALADELGTQSPAPVPEMLRTPVVARMLGIDKSTLNRWVKAGRFPVPTRLGASHPVWPREVVEKWIAEQAATPQARTPRGVATWTPEQHRAREAAKREAHAQAAKRSGKRGMP